MGYVHEDVPVDARPELHASCLKLPHYRAQHSLARPLPAQYLAVSHQTASMAQQADPRLLLVRPALHSDAHSSLNVVLHA